MRRRIRFLSGLALAAAASLSPAAAADKSGVPVDLELVLAVDISYSMDAEEQEMQREGYRAAIVSRPVLEAIAQGMIGRIAVAYVEWAGAEEQRVVVPWTLIDGAESAAAFAEKLAAAPLRRAYRTSISGALVHSAKLFETSGFSGARKVVDISGDGPNNQGEPVELVRDEVLDRGITVNGLPLMLKRPSFAMMDVGDLDAYYRDCVIGGPGAFMVPVNDWSQFPEAIRRKLVMELAQHDSPADERESGEGMQVILAAATPAYDCLVGEKLWRDRSWMWESR